MAKDLSNIRVYADDASQVSIAAKGTSGPIDLADLAPPWTDLGWLSDDGVTLGRSTDVTEFKGWQGGAVVRKKVTKTDNTFKFRCLEETAVVLGLMHPGLAGTTAAGVSTMTVPAGIAADRRAMVVDLVDGTVHTRYVCPDVEVSDRGDIVFKSDEMTVYEFTVTVYGDFTIITDNPEITFS